MLQTASGCARKTFAGGERGGQHKHGRRRAASRQLNQMNQTHGASQGGFGLVMKRVIMMGAVLAALAAATPTRAEPKLAFVDVQRALNDCSAGKKARADFRPQIERIQNKLQKQQSEVQSLKEELEKKGMLMKDDERRNLAEEYGRKARDFERAFKDNKEELERKDAEMTGAIVRDLAFVIRELGEKKGYTMVMEKSAILWGAQAIDITDEVVRSYNEAGGKIGSLGGEPRARSAGEESSFGQQAAKKSSISK
jgi:outer membrane protein